MCVGNRGNVASLERGKVYRVIAPRPTDPATRIRVVDEDAEDYLYPAGWFVPITVSASQRPRAMAVVG
ncbi:MAG TPA: hypothetical protein VK324_08590 [Tepidisphaeraceae bacterium]|nr:hypothetical protein [Tepidisphaeraceae bacterium]